MLEIDKFAYQSRWRHVSGELKFVQYMLLLIGAFLVSVPVRWGGFCVLMFLTPYIVRVTFFRYLKWLALPLGFLVISLVSLVLSFSDSPDGFLWHIGDADWFFCGISRASVAIAVDTLSRSLCCLAATYLFMLTTPFNQLIQLMKRTHLPKVLIEQILLTYRFIFIVLEEANSIFQAQSLRFGYGSKRVWFHSLALLVVMLLERVFERYNVMQTALAVKLYQGEFHR